MYVSALFASPPTVKVYIHAALSMPSLKWYAVASFILMSEACFDASFFPSLKAHFYIDTIFVLTSKVCVYLDVFFVPQSKGYSYLDASFVLLLTAYIYKGTSFIPPSKTHFYVDACFVPL